jgi:hypothetical protein
VRVGAAAFVAAEARAVVVVAHDDRDRLVAKTVQNLVRPGGITDEIAEHVTLVDANAGDVGQHGLEGEDVGV